VPVGLGRLYVEAPPFTSLPYGLMSVAVPMETGDRHWRAGVEYQLDPCDAAGAVMDECPEGTPISKAATADGLEIVGNEPFTVYAWIDCATVGFNDAEAHRRTSAALTNGEARTVERVLWTGDAGGTVNPHLAANAGVIDNQVTLQTAATVVTGGAVDIVEAMGNLEGALADCYGGVGIIHVPRKALAHLVAHNQVVRDGQRLRTMGGTWIAAGAGYPGTGPDGTEPSGSQEWFYATGQVAYRRGEVTFSSSYPEAINRGTNSVVLVAERTYVIGWDCCHFAQLVDLRGVPVE
jgi:hypothetical protein